MGSPAPDLNTDADASALLGGAPMAQTAPPMTAPATGLNSGPAGGFQQPVTGIGTGGIQPNRQPAPPAAAGTPAVDPIEQGMMQSMQRQDQLMAQSMQANAERQRRTLQAGTEFRNTTHQVIAKELASMKQASRYETQDISQAANQWMMLIGAFSALIGARGRGYSTAALNAFAGGIEGFAKGKEQQAQEHYKQWKANSEAALRDSEMELKKMDLVLKDAKLNWDQQMAEIEMIGAEFRDPLAMEMARQKNYTMFAAFRDKRAALQEKMQEHHDNMVLKIADHEEKRAERIAKMQNLSLSTPGGLQQLSQITGIPVENLFRQQHPGGAVLTNENLKPSEKPAAPAAPRPTMRQQGWESRAPNPTIQQQLAAGDGRDRNRSITLTPGKEREELMSIPPDTWVIDPTTGIPMQRQRRPSEAFVGFEAEEIEMGAR
jgi:hypothetical protein